MGVRPFVLGKSGEGANATRYELPAHHLVTHGVIVGMTGSGKTGLAMCLVEEALRSRVPVLMIDVKGDLPNLLLTFPGLSPEEFQPWVDVEAAQRAGRTAQEVATELSERWTQGLRTWDLGPADVAAFRAGIAPRILTPGTTAAEPVHVLSSLEQPSSLWDDDEEAARESLSASISLLLRLVSRDGDPARSRAHVVLAHFAERRLRAGGPAGLTELLADLAKPPLRSIGAMPIDEFLPAKDRTELAQELNTLLASPSFKTWLQGAPLDVGAWLRPGADGKTPAVLVSVAHLDDSERALVLGLLLESVLAWVRGLPGTSELRALLVFDEVYGFLPPHPANPPTKKPLLALMKQARAFGVGVLLATQNPMDLDYKALSNAGLWCVGRLQTDADRERVVEGLAGTERGTGGLDPSELAQILKELPARTFFVRNVHAASPTARLATRWTLSWLRGPMTRQELRRLAKGSTAAIPQQSAPAPVPTPLAAPMVRAVSEPQVLPSQMPVAPVGWRVCFGPTPPEPVSRWSYHPWLVATIVVHVRDAKLNINETRSRLVVAPLTAEGRPELLRMTDILPEQLRGIPPEGARFAPLPEALSKKTTVTQAERMVRDQAGRSFSLTMVLNDELGIVQNGVENSEAFLTRCRAEATRRATEEKVLINDKHTPKISKLETKLAAAKEELEKAKTEEARAPGMVGAALLGVIAGAKNAQRAHRVRDKAERSLEKWQKAVTDTEALLQEALGKRDAELRACDAQWAAIAEKSETRVLVAKKTDVEVTDFGIVWAAGA